MTDLFKNFTENINLFDIFFLIILSYNVFQCFIKGFSLSLISFMKWILSTIVTIIIVPKFQPIVRDYVESDFLNNIGLVVAIFFAVPFLALQLALAGKLISIVSDGIIGQGSGSLLLGTVIVIYIGLMGM